MVNLTLLTDKFGRHALTSDERRGAWIVAAFLGTALSLFVWHLVDSNTLVGMTALCVALSTIPAAVIFQCPPGTRRWTLAAGTAGLTLMAITPLVGVYLSVAGFLDAATVAPYLAACGKNFSTAFIGSQILAMAMVTKLEQ